MKCHIFADAFSISLVKVVIIKKAPSFFLIFLLLFAFDSLSLFLGLTLYFSSNIHSVLKNHFVRNLEWFLSLICPTY